MSTQTQVQEHTLPQLHLLPYVLVDSGIRVAASPGQMGVSGGGGGGLINTSLTKQGCLTSFLFRPQSGLSAFKGNSHSPSLFVPTSIFSETMHPTSLMQHSVSTPASGIERRLLFKPEDFSHCCGSDFSAQVY